ncbi:hypothetical protein JCM8097_005992 [Rhodosporidiobolus ruineniae]
MTASLPSTTTTAAASDSATYPPQNSLQAALQQQRQDGAEEMVDVPVQERQCHSKMSDEEREAMRLRGGCFNMGLCG